MITSQTYDIAASRAREDAIMLHIGRMTVKSAAIDEATTALLVHLLAPANEARAVATLGPEMFGAKKRMLERALPADWTDRKPLLRAMQRVEEYRNSLAHSTVHTFYGVVHGSERTRLHSVKAGWVDPDTDQFDSWQDRGDVIWSALVELSYLRSADVHRHAVRDLLQSHFGPSPRPGIVATINDLFPEKGRKDGA